jgi:oligopeptide/dipeptide ABC transporter ATP-binding protein
MTVDTIEGGLSRTLPPHGDQERVDVFSRLKSGAEIRPGDLPILGVHDLKVVIARNPNGAPLVSQAELTVHRAEVVGLVGETGSGKSLVARSIAGLLPRGLKITKGEIRFDGRDLATAKKAQLRAVHGTGISYVPQNPFAALEPVMKIDRQFRAAARAHTSWDKQEVRDRALDRLHEVGLRDPARILDSYAHQLSGGMAQRVVIALSTLFTPKLVVADEPTTGLDPTVQKKVLETLVKACTEVGSSLLLISHDLGIVSEFADRINVMYAGRTVEMGPADMVFSDPLHPYTWGLLATLPRSGQPGVVMGGNLPDPNQRGAGCEFTPRCPHATSGCGIISPAMEEVLLTRHVACHLYRDSDVDLGTDVELAET